MADEKQSFMKDVCRHGMSTLKVVQASCTCQHITKLFPETAFLLLGFLFKHMDIESTNPYTNVITANDYLRQASEAIHGFDDRSFIYLLSSKNLDQGMRECIRTRAF
jgi:hypothetical protein